MSNMAFFGLLYKISYSGIFIIVLTGSFLFPVIFTIELSYFELKLNQLNDF